MSENTSEQRSQDERLREIDAQPLEDRAVAYAEIHAELAAQLESGTPQATNDGSAA